MTASLPGTTEYFKHLITSGYSKAAMDEKENSLHVFKKHLDKNHLSDDPKTWNKNLFIEYFSYLKTYKYKKADNKINGYQRNPNERIYIYKSLNEQSILLYLRNLKLFTAYLYQIKFIPTYPFESLNFKPTIKNQLKKDVTEKEISVIIEEINTSTILGYRDRTMFEILYGLGLREGELFRLDIKDINLKEGWAFIQGKGKRQRILPLPMVTSSYLRHYIQHVRPRLLKRKNLGEGALILSARGSRMHKISIGRIVRDYARKAGVFHITTHKLRHAFAMHMLRKGCNVRTIQELLGHEKLDTTQIYTEVYDNDLKKKINRYHPGSIKYKKLIKRRALNSKTV